jgi:hypothetical protein
VVPLVLLGDARIDDGADSARHPCGRVVPRYDEKAADDLVGST